MLNIGLYADILNYRVLSRYYIIHNNFYWSKSLVQFTLLTWRSKKAVCINRLGAGFYDSLFTNGWSIKKDSATLTSLGQ